MKQRPIAAAIALALGLAIACPASAEWGPAPAGVAAVAGNPIYDARTASFGVAMQVENRGAEDLTGKLRIVVTDSTLAVTNADGTTLDGLPYFDLSTSYDYSLAPGAASDAVEVHFGPVGSALRDRNDFRYTVAVRNEAADDGESFTLQLLHAADIDGKGPLEDVRAFSALVGFFQSEMPNNTLTLSSGDNWIPGTVYNAAADERLADLLGTPGRARAHVQFLNLMGFEASAVGNHDLDNGPSSLVTGIAPDGDWAGASFPYLSTNLDFALDATMAPLVVAEGQPAHLIPGKVAGTATVTVGGETIGIVGASTPKLNQITSLGNIGIRPADKNDIDALAAEIQKGVDSLLAMGVNKVILIAHMQQIAIEQQLAQLLRGVDIVVAGGSNTRLLDDNDLFYPGDETKGGTYPLAYTSPDGEPVLVVNTDGDFKYLGRLILDFDSQGRILPESLDPVVNGAYASFDQVLANLLLSEEQDANPEVVALADALQAIVDELAGNAFGLASVYLRGERQYVRTEETNLGDLTADANLWYALQTDDRVQISLKNGGGIRAAIGQITYPPGSTDPEDAELSPPDGGLVNQLDVQAALSFNNALSLVTVTAADLQAIVEHGVAATAPGVTPGQFPQVSGIRFSFDPSLPAAARVRSLAVVDESGAVIDTIVQDGALVGDPARTFRMVTLGFLADGGDGYPFPSGDAAERVNLNEAMTDPGTATFSDPGTEQDAFAEYLLARFNTVAFDRAETPPAQDLRIQNLSARGDAVFAIPGAGAHLAPVASLKLNAAEISAYDPASKRLFVTDAGEAAIQVVDLTNPAAPTLIDTIGPLGAGVTSVAVKNGLVAVAVHADPATDPGQVVLLDAASGSERGRATVGALPDMVTFDKTGSRVLVANEGEPSDETDPPGSIGIVDVSNPAAPVVRLADFTAFNAEQADLEAAGLRIYPGKLLSDDLEPEYVAVSEDNATAYVSLQEANALASVDIATATATAILPLGLKDHSKLFNALDASDRDSAVNIRPWPVLGMYMPDGIATFAAGGEAFVATANEGDARALDAMNEEVRVKNLTLDPVAFPDAATLQQDAELGRLTVSKIDGDTGGDGSYDALQVFGARSFTLFRIDADGARVAWDSQDSLERIGAQLTPDLFNANDGDPDEKDGRSDNKGPEPEGVTLAEIAGRRYAFVVLERAAGGVVMYDVTNPYAPRFMDYAPGVTDGHISAEQSLFIAAADSPSGEPLLVTSNEESASIGIYRVIAP